MSDRDQRFGGIARLYSNDGLRRLGEAHVCVIGVGGVGAWAVEALARSGVGAITMVDLDEVCVTNVNRQLHATDKDIGRPKVEVMSARIRGINPDCRVRTHVTFFTGSTAATILEARFDYVLDAIDDFRNKSLLLATCRKLGIPACTTGGAGGRRDPARLRVDDLSRAHGDILLKRVRKSLRHDYGFPAEGMGDFGIGSVFSHERPVYPHTDGSVCEEKPPGGETRLTCESGFGTASFVTGAYGFAAAGSIVEALAAG